ncbi:MAG TPA: hypothetical protein VOA00_02545 [Thermoanaerobaculia bacterium]|nr:hypothetical protein [Thermoanaerobaculia bacterium]
MARERNFPGGLRIGLLVACAALAAAVSSAGVNQWTSIGPFGPGGNVRVLAVDAGSPGVLYAGTDGGIFKSLDGGVSWGAVNNGLTGFIVFAIAIDPSAGGTLYAGTNAGVFKSVNGGNFWSAARSGIGKVAVRSLAVDPSNGRVLYAGTAAGGVFRSTDAGSTWISSSSGLTNPEVRALAVDPFRPATIYAGTATGLFKSTDAAMTWASSLSASLRVVTVDPATPSTVYAGTDGVFQTSGVFKSADGGVTWGPTNSGLGDVTVLSMAVRQSQPSTAFVGTLGAGLFVTTDGGSSWKPIAGSPATANAVALDPFGPNIYVGTTAGFFRSPDEGKNWRQEVSAFSTFTVNGLAIDAASPTTLYAGVGRPGSGGGGVFKTSNGGGTWTPASSGLPDRTVQALAIDSTFPSTLYVGVSGAGVFRSRDGGATWTAANAGLSTNTVFSFAAGGSGTVYAGTDTGAFRSTDGGLSWTSASTGLTSSSVQALAVVPSNPSAVYAGTPGGVFRTADGGRTWTSSSAGLANIGVLSLVVDPVTPSTLYAGTFSAVSTGTPSGFGVYRSLDAGATWSPANGAIEGLAVTALATDPTGAIVYAGTPSGVFRLARGGHTWTGVNEGLSEVVNTIVVDPRSPSTVYAGTLGDSVFQIAFAGGTGGCTSGPSTLCLNENRFKAEVTWRALNIGTSGVGMAIPLTSDTGAFWFFTSGNVELVLKVVDGRPFNGSFWVFYGAMSDVSYTITVTDTLTGLKKTYDNAQGQLASVADTSAFVGFASGAAAASAAAFGGPAPASRADVTAPCVADATTLCLNANRFRVQVEWVATNIGQTGVGQSAPLSSDTGSFWFFSSGNLELNIKVVDGRSLNARFWVFYGALSDVGYTITVTDTQTGLQRTYTNPQGRLASVADTSAF